MINIMKEEQILGVFVCLLLSCASTPLNAVPEEGEEYTNITDAELPPLKPVHSFCAMRADGGLCKALIKRFFFNIHTQQCEEFIYGGCKGNQNRFETLEECKQKCTRDYPKKMKTTLQKVNDFQVDDYRTQVDAVNNTSLTPQPSREPSSFEYYGPSWCLTPADRGLCRANETRFYYNSLIGKCCPFKYSGCGGNENNFTTKKACIRACKKGFIQRISKEGLIKTKRKRKNQPVKIVYEEIIVKKI
ncbi:tissue factor pathway inhibitor isoform X2 [Moschus berezovskii]|uniref:tissue factor pathway inhibitor isoform X2 n=1 Tax=Moschus berezovskii TaxID=68408 RepID=UPI002443CD85|nr:tissue factor pathway inhibitor isoform X2 [Moschus berezovskii]